MEADGVSHRHVEVNGVRLHVAEKGEGPLVVLLHGFPELWYSWRHQILSLSSRGFRAVAPDLRGFGASDSPPSPRSYTYFHTVGDLVALIETLLAGREESTAFVVGHDWGAMIAWQLCLWRPDLVRALVNLSVPYSPRSPAARPIESFRSAFGDDVYLVRFQDPGAIEALFAKLGTEYVIKKFLTYHYPEPPYISKHIEDPLGTDTTLPSWLTPEDISYYSSKFESSGFTGPVNYYRCMDLNWELTAPWTSAQIKVPTKFIVGDVDISYNYPGMQDFIQKGGMKKYVPFLDEVVVMKGVGHFIQQERAAEVSEHIIDFLEKYRFRD